MTAVQLSARCEELGLPIHRTTLSKIEKGRSSFDLAELIVLARALNVPPLQLIYPDLPDGIIEAWPSQNARAVDAAQWFSGERIQLNDGRFIESTYAGLEGETVPRLEVSRLISNAAQQLQRQYEKLEAIRASDSTDKQGVTEAALARIDHHTRDLRSFLMHTARDASYTINPGIYPPGLLESAVMDTQWSAESARILAERIEAKRTKPEDGPSDGQG